MCLFRLFLVVKFESQLLHFIQGDPVLLSPSSTDFLWAVDTCLTSWFKSLHFTWQFCSAHGSVLLVGCALSMWFFNSVSVLHWNVHNGALDALERAQCVWSCMLLSVVSFVSWLSEALLSVWNWWICSFRRGWLKNTVSHMSQFFTSENLKVLRLFTGSFVFFLTTLSVWATPALVLPWCCHSSPVAASCCCSVEPGTSLVASNWVTSEVPRVAGREVSIWGLVVSWEVAWLIPWGGGGEAWRLSCVTAFPSREVSTAVTGDPAWGAVVFPVLTVWSFLTWSCSIFISTQQIGAAEHYQLGSQQK